MGISDDNNFCRYYLARRLLGVDCCIGGTLLLWRVSTNLRLIEADTDFENVTLSSESGRWGPPFSVEIPIAGSDSGDL